MISVITPTFNRCHTLGRLFDSLCAQDKGHLFEWVLVDDGSIDGTRQWFEGLDASAGFTRKCVYQVNQGKHVALNTGVSVANGQWCLILDSDDALTDGAMVRLMSDLDGIGDDHAIMGVCYRRQNFDGVMIGKSVRGGRLEMTPNQAGELFKGDLAYVFRTSALRSNPFPVFHNEKFVPEQLVWNRISDSGKILYYPETAIYLCDYLPDGYSANFKSMLRQNPRGFGWFYADQVRRLPLGLPRLKSMLRLIQCKYYRLRWR